MGRWRARKENSQISGCMLGTRVGYKWVGIDWDEARKSPQCHMQGLEL